MVPHVLDERIVKRGGPERERPVFGIPSLQVILPDEQAKFVGHVIERRVIEMAVQPDEVNVHLAHEPQIAFVGGTVHLGKVEVVIVVGAADKHPPPV